MKFEGTRVLRQVLASLGARYGDARFHDIPVEEIGTLSSEYGESGKEMPLEPDSGLGYGKRENPVTELLRRGTVLGGISTYHKERLRLPGEYTFGDALNYAREKWDEFHVRRHLTALGFLALVGGIALLAPQLNRDVEKPIQPFSPPPQKQEQQEPNRQFNGYIGILPVEIKLYPGFTWDDYCRKWQEGKDPKLNPLSACVEYPVRANADRYDALGRRIVENPDTVRWEVRNGVPSRVLALPYGVSP